MLIFSAEGGRRRTGGTAVVEGFPREYRVPPSAHTDRKHYPNLHGNPSAAQEVPRTQERAREQSSRGLPLCTQLRIDRDSRFACLSWFQKPRHVLAQRAGNRQQLKIRDRPLSVLDMIDAGWRQIHSQHLKAGRQNIGGPFPPLPSCPHPLPDDVQLPVVIPCPNR